MTENAGNDYANGIINLVERIRAETSKWCFDCCVHLSIHWISFIDKLLSMKKRIALLFERRAHFELRVLLWRLRVFESKTVSSVWFSPLSPSPWFSSSPTPDETEDSSKRSVHNFTILSMISNIQQFPTNTHRFLKSIANESRPQHTSSPKVYSFFDSKSSSCKVDHSRLPLSPILCHICPGKADPN